MFAILLTGFAEASNDAGDPSNVHGLFSVHNRTAGSAYQKPHPAQLGRPAFRSSPRFTLVENPTNQNHQVAPCDRPRNTEGSRASPQADR
jgi:hypothetical protein